MYCIDYVLFDAIKADGSKRFPLCVAVYIADEHDVFTAALLISCIWSCLLNTVATIQRLKLYGRDVKIHLS